MEMVIHSIKFKIVEKCSIFILLCFHSLSNLNYKFSCIWMDQPWELRYLFFASLPPPRWFHFCKGNHQLVDYFVSFFVELCYADMFRRWSLMTLSGLMTIVSHFLPPHVRWIKLNVHWSSNGDYAESGLGFICYSCDFSCSLKYFSLAEEGTW